MRRGRTGPGCVHASQGFQLRGRRDWPGQGVTDLRGKNQRVTGRRHRMSLLTKDGIQIDWNRGADVECPQTRSIIR